VALRNFALLETLVGQFDSKKVEKSDAMLSACTTGNCARIHQTLRVRPAMEASVLDHVSTVRKSMEMVETMTLEKAS
jgi:hypothetical protein